MHHDRAAVLPDVRVAVPAAPCTTRRHQDAGAEGRAAAVEVLGDAPGGWPVAAGRAGIQRLRHPQTASRAPRVHGPVRARQPRVPIAAAVVHLRLDVPHRRLHVPPRIRRDHRDVAEKRSHRLRQRRLVCRLLHHQNRAALVPASLRTSRQQKGNLFNLSESPFPTAA